MDRRSIIILIIGVIASLAGFATPAFLRQRRCHANAGAWDNATRQCVTSAGERIDVAVLSDVVIGAIIALALAFMLFRILLFAMGRMARRAP